MPGFGLELAAPVLVLLAFLVVKTCQSVLVQNIGARLGLQFRAIFAKTLRLLPLAVHRYDLHRTFGGYGHKICGKDLVRGIGYLSCQNVGFEEIVGIVERFKLDVACREMFLGLDICIDLVVETAFEFGTLTGKFLRIHRQILKTCGSG